MNPDKPNLSCFVTEFRLAMEAVSKVHDYGRGPLLKGDYLPSLLRHLFGIGEHPDHDAAAVWNALARLEMKLRQETRIAQDVQIENDVTWGEAPHSAAVRPMSLWEEF